MSADEAEPEVEEWVAECPHDPICWSERECIALEREEYARYGR